jgi:ankyrin repeat protein
MLLDAGATVDFTQEPVLVLTAACEELQPESVKMLLDAGAVFDASEKSVKLIESVISHRPTADEDHAAQTAVLQLLLEKWVATVPHQQGLHGNPWDNLMHHCVMKADRTTSSAICNTLLHHYPELLDLSPGYYYSPLMTAIEWKHTEMVTALLEAGADLSVPLERRGCFEGTLFYPWFMEPRLQERHDFLQIVGTNAIRKSVRDTLRIILDAGADPTAYAHRYDQSEDELPYAPYIKAEENQLSVAPATTYPSSTRDERTLLMDLMQSPLDFTGRHRPNDMLYQFPDSDCCVYISMILDAVT